MMNHNEPIFLQIKGGWLNPTAILQVQTHPQNELMLTIGVAGIDRPIVLNETDSAYVRAYLQSRTWPQAKQEPQGFIPLESGSHSQIQGIRVSE